MVVPFRKSAGLSIDGLATGAVVGAVVSIVLSPGIELYGTLTGID
jgi:hypothetical protein